MPTPNKRTARALPADVKAALADAVKKLKSQSKAAAALQVSGSVVSQLLNGVYPGDVDTMADRIRGKFMAQTVKCPVMGDLARNECLNNQARAFAATNPLRTALHKACKTCPNRKEAS
ncbi:MAG: XRE family transcriptional regulator [Burkholderiales bacterium]|nr:XRE family transcriptional regulator [Burkholderiales bacterium]